ncbi:small integral membrane protein 20 [Ciconia maguari]
MASGRYGGAGPPRSCRARRGGRRGCAGGAAVRLVRRDTAKRGGCVTAPCPPHGGAPAPGCVPPPARGRCPPPRRPGGGGVCRCFTALLPVCPGSGSRVASGLWPPAAMAGLSRTLGIFGGFVAVVGAAFYPIYFRPLLLPEEYKKEQSINRAGIVQEDIQPAGLKVWSDPFGRK